MNCKSARQKLARLQSILNKYAERFATDPDGDKEIIAEGMLALQEMNVLTYALCDGLRRANKRIRVLEVKYEQRTAH